MTENHPYWGFNNSYFNIYFIVNNLIFHSNFAVEVWDGENSRAKLLGNEPNYSYSPHKTQENRSLGDIKCDYRRLEEPSTMLQSRT